MGKHKNHKRKHQTNPHKLTEHHRKPRSKGGKRTKRNISRVPRNQHEAFITLFENKDPQEIIDDFNERWLDPDYVAFVIKKKFLVR